MPTQTTLARVESFPFDSRADGYDADGYPVYDRAVGATLLRSTFAKFFSDGVFPSPGTALQISKGSGLTVTIDPGVFIINGAMGGYLTDAHSVTLDTAAPQGNVAYGIMLRYDENEQYRSCYIRVVRGCGGHAAAARAGPEHAGGHGVPARPRDGAVWGHGPQRGHRHQREGPRGLPVCRALRED